MTGCGCVSVVALIAALLFFLVRGSFDSGEPLETP
jgi:hypothetical protein